MATAAIKQACARAVVFTELSTEFVNNRRRTDVLQPTFIRPPMQHHKRDSDRATRAWRSRIGLITVVFLASTIVTAAMARRTVAGANEIGLQPGTAMVAFAPHASPVDLLIGAIDGAQSSVRLAAYAFSHKGVVTALVRARKRGLDVAVVADSTSASQRYSAVQSLANQGVATRINDRYAILHHKLAVIDAQTVWTGSANMTSAAERRNAENAILLINQPALAKHYAAEWQRLWDESTAVTSNY